MQKIQKTSLLTYSRVLLIVFLLVFALQPASATDILDVNPVDIPQGAVILIIDGLGSPYIYPDLTPYALDGQMLPKSQGGNLSLILSQSYRVLDVRAPQTYTEAGHSVLVTGYSNALSDVIAGSGTTIYDVAHEYDYYTFAVMHKGDFASLCSKQDVIVRDVSNSVNQPEMLVMKNIPAGGQKQITMEVAALMQDSIPVLNDQLKQFPEGSQQRYDIYNNWAIHTAIDVIDHMQANYPKEHYLLTINVGAVDSAGHYKKDTGYIASIDGIDAACMDLYIKCKENKLAFIFTADHGMAFPSPDSRGGHQAAKYSKSNEAQMIPFSISLPGIANNVVEGSYGQEDIAPTILDILYLPNELRLSDGDAIPLRDNTALKISVPHKGSLEIIRSGDTIYSTTLSESSLLRGVETGYSYNIRFTSDDSSMSTMEKEIFLTGSEHIDFSLPAANSKSDVFFRNPRYLVGSVLIVIINIGGFVLIKKILRE
ncbi:alkaline phosphatase family protein [Methanolobus sp.]|uniref:alkaline phosphatase family protein n=1 Tax=Methanolobus sp. TaxID=1874737 RepID=UPI0025E48F01|nr:alkaline phosphatase family protein [Methanolobus sp.]